MPQQVPAVKWSRSHGWHQPKPSSDDSCRLQTLVRRLWHHIVYCLNTGTRPSSTRSVGLLRASRSRELVSCECLPG